MIAKNATRSTATNAVMKRSLMVIRNNSAYAVKMKLKNSSFTTTPITSVLRRLSRMMLDQWFGKRSICLSATGRRYVQYFIFFCHCRQSSFYAFSATYLLFILLSGLSSGSDSVKLIKPSVGESSTRRPLWARVISRARANPSPEPGTLLLRDLSAR